MPIRRNRKACIALVILLFVIVAFYLFYGKKDLSISISPSKDMEVMRGQSIKSSANTADENESLSPELAEDTSKEPLDLEKVVDDAVSFQSFIYPSLPGVYSNTEGVGQPMDPVFLLSYMESGVDKIIVPFAHGGASDKLSFHAQKLV